MNGVRISSHFLDDLRKERGMSKAAFISACGLTVNRFEELYAGAEPTLKEFSTITTGFQLENGIPMIAIPAQKLVA